MGITEAILALITNAPAAINEISSLYNAVKGDLSATDQATIDSALTAAIQADATATAAADQALADAVNR